MFYTKIFTQIYKKFCMNYANAPSKKEMQGNNFS